VELARGLRSSSGAADPADRRARITDGLALVLQRVIDVLMQPGKALWNWLAGFDRARALRIQPIAVTETRIIRVPSSEMESVEEAVR